MSGVNKIATKIKLLCSRNRRKQEIKECLSAPNVRLTKAKRSQKFSRQKNENSISCDHTGETNYVQLHNRKL